MPIVSCARAPLGVSGAGAFVVGPHVRAAG